MWKGYCLAAPVRAMVNRLLFSGLRQWRLKALELALRRVTERRAALALSLGPPALVCAHRAPLE